MYRKDELIHMGIKGMKWRKGRKTPITVVNLHDERQKQIDAKRKNEQDSFEKRIESLKKKNPTGDTTKSKFRNTSKTIVKGAKPPVTWKQHTKKKSKLS